MNSEQIMKAAQRKLGELADLAKAGSEAEDGCADRVIDQCIALVTEAGRLLAIAEVERSHEHEILAREGIITGEGRSRRAVYAWKLGLKSRTAEVFPNARNDGRTHCVKTTWSENPYVYALDKWHGGDWDFEEACVAAREWILDGVVPVHPMEIVKRIMER